MADAADDCVAALADSGGDADERRLAVFRALGDPTRYALHRAIAEAGRPISTAELADSLDLHPNTLRPHLERMRDAGLLELAAESRGSVGRPQHRWSLAPGAPAFGLEPSSHTVLATLLAGLAAQLGTDPETVAAIGRQQGRVAADEQRADRSSGLRRGGCLAGLVAELSDLGFEPVRDDGAGDGAHLVEVAFARCPYADLAEAFPGVVCNLHRGIVEGFVERAGGAAVESFATLEDRDPCRVALAVG